jgi:hypothetical protein
MNIIIVAGLPKPLCDWFDWSDWSDWTIELRAWVNASDDEDPDVTAPPVTALRAVGSMDWSSLGFDMVVMSSVGYVESRYQQLACHGM